MSRCRLLALDLDGTLLRDDGGIDPRDRAAVRRAEDAGIAVTLATGRLPHGAVPTARELKLTTPTICADGAITVIPATGVVLDRRALSPAATAAFITLGHEHGAPLLFLGDATVVGRPQHRDAATALQGWSDRFVPVDLLDAPADVPGPPPLAAFLLGTRVQVDRLAQLCDEDAVLSAAARDGAIELVELGHPERWGLRLRAGGVDKGVALARLAGQMGLAHDQVAAVGDWYNDLPMFDWAGRSFAMGHAPPDVARRAKQRLTATAAQGGGIAEAIDSLMRG
jgi:hydroxymethylpyrimidine pyrophosphatase-like HAD family hydrolase